MKRNYRKVIGWLLALILALPFAVATVEGQTTQQQPSAKVTAKTSQFTLIPPTTGTGGWVTILSNNIKTAEMKDLFVTAALEAGVYTQTAVTGKSLCPFDFGPCSLSQFAVFSKLPESQAVNRQHK